MQSSIVCVLLIAVISIVVADNSGDSAYPVAAASDSYGGGYGGGYSGGESYGGYKQDYKQDYQQPSYGSGQSYYAKENGPGYYGPQTYDDSYGGFQCAGKKPAFYGDAKQDCKVFYICQSDGRTDTFRCPKWTRFNNYLGICDWHFKVDNSCNPLDTYDTNSYSSKSYGGDYAQSYGGGYSKPSY